MLRECLQKILSDASSGGQSIPLSNLKRLFRSKFHAELSETSLGYAKLSELLQDSRVSDLCDVKLQGHGYVMVPAQPKPKRNLISLADSLCLDSAGTGVPTPEAAPISGDNLLQKRAGFVQPLCMDEILSEESSPKATTSQLSVHASAQTFLATTPARTPFPCTPSPTSTLARSLPRLLGATRRKPQAPPLDDIKGAVCIGGEVGSPRLAVAKTTSISPEASVPAAPGLHLGDVAKGQMPGSRRAAMWPSSEQPWQLPPLTPSTLGNFGFSVQNTFIHAAMPPPTPMRVGSQHRARSLPRDTC
mmetsp:Transcript_74841/g.189176  ORF Transcript_74841/g.189176 Transcript_74841/m.189176 type:complete len:303 (-) Transcript_74841:93-1001(-)